jgi:tetratricopeptide (TPR) repeat protein
MKWIKKNVAAFGTITLLATSCQNALDIKPTLILSDQTALTTTTGLQSAVIGLYRVALRDQVLGGQSWCTGEYIAGNVRDLGGTSFEETQFINRNLTTNNSHIDGFWRENYSMIALANNILKAEPTVTDQDIAKARNQIRGESLFMRGLGYFELVRYFGHPTGLGVPILTEPVGDVNFSPKRASVDEVYARAIADLQQAETLLPDVNGDGTRAGRLAAQALLARVYFYKKDYTKAEEYATKVISSNKFQLAVSTLDNYKAGSLSSEVIFGLANNPQEEAGYLRGKFQSTNPKMAISDDLWGRMDTTGKRIQDVVLQRGGYRAIKKYDVIAGNIPVIRLAELYLIRAEARLNNNNTAGALTDYNTTRIRAGLSAATTVTLQSIMRERTTELVFEGDDFHNRKRAQVQIAGLSWSDNRLYLPIQRREYIVNKNLDQNPGYSKD